MPQKQGRMRPFQANMRKMQERETSGSVYIPVRQSPRKHCIAQGSDSHHNFSEHPNVVGESPLPPAETAAAGSSSLGYSSFRSIYKAARKKLWVSTPDESTSFSPGSEKQSSQPDPLVQPSSSTSAFTRNIEKCLKILRNIPCVDEAQVLFDSHFSPHSNFIRPVAQYMLTSLYNAFGRYLSTNRKESQLAELARIISENTGQPLSDDHAEPTQWMDQFSGSNTRWETLGVLFSYWELGVGIDMPCHSTNPKSQASPKSKARYHESVVSCLDLAKTVSVTPNCLVLYLTYKKLRLEDVFKKDIAFSCWQSQADMVTLATYLGIHMEPYARGKSHLSSEFRRRLFWTIFNTDKAISTFTGRPPLIGRKYLSTPIPLDLKDELLLSEESTITTAISLLGVDGWNTDNALNPATTLRAQTMFSVIRDELLEMALGDPASYSIDDAEKVRARQEQTMDSLPSVLAFDPDDLQDLSIDIDTLYTRLKIRLEHLQNVLFVERLIRRHTKRTTAMLLNIIFELVSTVLLFWKYRELFGEVRNEFESIIMQYGAPGGGILCLELLKPTHDINTASDRLRMTRSDIIQQLTLLSAFIDWISPSVAQDSLILECKTVIQGTLNQILNSPTQNYPLIEPINWDFCAQSDLNVELFNTLDWLGSGTLME